MTAINTDLGQNIRDYPAVTVYVRAGWNDEWVEQTNLRVRNLSFTTAPSMPQAVLTYHYGDIEFEDEDRFTHRGVLDLNRKYVKIEYTPYVAPGTTAQDDVKWVGVVVNTQDSQIGTNLNSLNQREAAGTQTLIAFGIEWFLTRNKVDRTYFGRGEGDPDIKLSGNGNGDPLDPLDSIYVKRAVPFNLGTGRNVKKKSGNRAVGTSLFALGRLATSTTWTAADIVEYILQFFEPLDALLRTTIPIIIETEDFIKLEWYEPVIVTEGRTVYQVLNQVMDRRRGLTWRLVYDDSATAGNPTVNHNRMLLKVYTFNEVDISFTGGRKIPRNESQKTLDYDFAVDIDGAMTVTDSVRKFDRIIARGARRTSTFSLTLKQGHFTEDGENEKIGTNYFARGTL